MYTYDQNYVAHLGLTGNRKCIIPDQVADDQKGHDGRTFPVHEYQAARNTPRGWQGAVTIVRIAKLIGDDYGLWTGGPGAVIVRHVRG